MLSINRNSNREEAIQREFLKLIPQGINKLYVPSASVVIESLFKESKKISDYDVKGLKRIWNMKYLNSEVCDLTDIYFRIHKNVLFSIHWNSILNLGIAG